MHHCLASTFHLAGRTGGRSTPTHPWTNTGTDISTHPWADPCTHPCANAGTHPCTDTGTYPCADAATHPRADACPNPDTHPRTDPGPGPSLRRTEYQHRPLRRVPRERSLLPGCLLLPQRSRCARPPGPPRRLPRLRDRRRGKPKLERVPISP